VSTRGRTPPSRAGSDPVARLGKIVAGRTLTRLFRTAPAVSGLVVGFGVLVCLPTGGFDKVRDDEIPVVALGDPFDAGFMTVSVTAVRLLPDADVLFHTHPGDRWIAVVAEIEVTDDRTLNELSLKSAFRLTGVQGLRGNVKDSLTGEALPDAAVLARDSQNLISLQPGVPERVGIVWEQDPAAPLPRTAQVEVYHFTEGVNTIGGDSHYWRPGADPGAKLPDVPVQDRRKG